MRVLRVILAGLVALFATLAVLSAAAVVLFAGLAAWVVQLFWKRPPSIRPHPVPAKRATMRTDDVIEVVTTKVPDDSNRQ